MTPGAPQWAVPRRFVHLHTRSGFSYGYGVATPEELVEEAARMGMASLALTDQDGLYGIPRFLKAATEHGILPIVGAEITMEAGGHLILLAKSMEGYRSLCRLITAYRTASEDRRKPLCPLDLLQEHTRGLVCLTGAIPYGLIPRLVLSGRTEKADRTLRLLQDAFGSEVFVEITDDRTAGSRRRIRRLARLAEAHGVPLLATNEVAYVRPRDHRLHDVLVAASSLTRLPGPGYRPTDQLYLKPPEKMEKLFEGHPEALGSVAAVSEGCAGAVKLAGRVHMPAVHSPGKEPPEKKLVRLVVQGARERYGKGPEERVRSRLRRELSCIFALGFVGYFLLAHEAIQIAREKGVPVTGRGSAANSLVAHCLGLTQPEPFENRLLFERFLHEHRKDPPDVDLDLDSERRDEVRDELIRRHESHGAAVAATANTFSLRGAVRAAARALGHPPGEIARLARHVPTRFSDRGRIFNPVSGWEQALSEPAMRGHPLQDRGKHRLLLDLSWRLSGRLHQSGTHLGGLVFGNDERHLSELAPLEPSGQPGLLRCQYDKDDLEYVGLPKLDLLGLKTHTALRKAGELVSERLCRRVDPLSSPPDDKETYALIRTGRNAGMFQLESPGQMHLSVRLKPRKFSDIVAQISLFRPGPVRGDLVTPYVMRRNSLEPYSVPLPELDEVLRPTYGILMYQEQVLEVAHRVAGFSLAEGDLLRRAMTKDRGVGAMDGIREGFVGRAVGRGVSRETAEEIFSWTEGFSAYGFPAAHAASFAHLSYASAYMRAHHPAEFFAGILNSQPMGFYSPRVLLNEARRIGVEILPPDIRLSGEGFTVEDEGRALRVGFSYCKELSEETISPIVSERRKRPFASAADLYRRTPVERDALENLIRAGFLDSTSTEADRLRLLAGLQSLPKKRRNGHQAEIPVPHPGSWWESREDRTASYLPLTASRLEKMEWAVLGLNVRHHPFVPYRQTMRNLGVTPSTQIRDLSHGVRVRAAGLIECLQCPPTKSGNPVWFLTLEDEHGLLQCTIFEGVYRRYGHVLHHRRAYLLEGRVEQDQRRGFSFLVGRIRDLSEALQDGERLPAPGVASAPGALLRARGTTGRAG